MSKGSKLGVIAFIVGLIGAAVIALLNYTAVPKWAVIALAVLGVVVGLLNVKDDEISLFLIAALAFLLSFGALRDVVTTLAFGWQAIAVFFNLMVVFVAPATAIVAVLALFRMAKN
ncbi:hypothetical protein HYV86_00875 [Candidatus Woesearchaeota archaeon]|nr:hypothetical protein [Candidatus Woesearchaeota archaeon]